jgi:hypothetical protein
MYRSKRPGKYNQRYRSTGRGVISARTQCDWMGFRHFLQLLEAFWARVRQGVEYLQVLADTCR